MLKIGRLQYLPLIPQYRKLVFLNIKSLTMKKVILFLLILPLRLAAQNMKNPLGAKVTVVPVES